VDSIDPAFDYEDVEHGEEVLGVFLEARLVPSHIFHFAKEAFDDVVHGAEIGIERGGVASIALGRNDS
jgi:hypothetical protein